MPVRPVAPAVPRNEVVIWIEQAFPLGGGRDLDAYPAAAAPFAGCSPEDTGLSDGQVVDGRGGRTMEFGAVLKQLGRPSVTGLGSGTFGSKDKPTVFKHSYGAHFVEVTWQAEIARLRVITPTRALTRSARAASARPAWQAPRPRSRTPSTTPQGSGSATCHCVWSSC